MLTSILEITKLPLKINLLFIYLFIFGTGYYNNNLDLIDEVRDEGMKRMENYKGAMAKYYNKKVNVRKFDVGDFVLRKVSRATKDLSQGKLGPS